MSVTSYRQLTALRRPDADHRDLPTTILPAVRRPSTSLEPAPADTAPAGYTGRHRDGNR
ncbi:hypothetical protein [Micromonospora sp. HUAS LYJ1]|uniref:hypothetical protein n=1 Tax=Micromonospora sp. HUAS LYJ1 TaxID=3061626 RepID=UPI002673AB12|nr:hypothetical protein [Micromonospora sp. HUAS LYJ1]WKU03723.1 hypothetical protein Q2K16_23205 [Micromonospora sp. HUAS LYJ1]